jgi:hypothetical protein
VISETSRVGKPTPTGTFCPGLASTPDAFVELEVVADARHAGQDVGPVPDEGRPDHRRADLAVFDEVGLGGGEHELAARDVHLPAAEVFGVQAAGHGADDVLRIVLAGEHERVGHARQGDRAVALPAAVARGRHLHEAAVERSCR